MILFSPQLWLFAALIGLALFALFRRSPVVPLILYFAWLTVEDLVRKLWGNDMTVYFAKFILILPIILKALRAWQSERYSLPHIMRAPLIAWVGVVLLNSFNPNLAHPLEALLGLHSDLLYLLVFLPVGYYLLRSPQKVATLFAFLCILAVFPTIVGVIQQTISPTFLNERVLTGTELRPFLDRGVHVFRESYFQVNSVFVGPGRFASYAGMMLLIGIGMGLLFSEHRRYSLVGWIGAGMAVIDILFSGNRRTMVTALLTFILFLWLVIRPRVAEKKFRIGTMLVQRLPFVAVAVAVLYVIAADPIERGVRYFSTTLLGAEERPSELSQRLPGYVRQLAMIPSFGLLGQGTGAASLGKQYLSGRLGIPVSPDVSENGFTDKAYAYGVVGLAVWLWLLGAILVALWDARKNAPDAQRKAFATLIFSFAVVFFTAAQLLGSQFIQDYLNQSYYWMLIGCALSCPYWVGKPFYSEKQ
jgi:hypothetical protein